MPDDKAIRDFVLAELRCAHLRAKSAQVEIEFIGDALKQDFITPADALMGLEAQGWGGFLDPIILAKLRAACGVDVG